MRERACECMTERRNEKEAIIERESRHEKKRQHVREVMREREKDRLINMRWRFLPTPLPPSHFPLAGIVPATLGTGRQAAASAKFRYSLSMSPYLYLSLYFSHSFSLSSDCLPQGLPLVKLPDCTISACVCWERPEMRTDSSRGGVAGAGKREGGKGEHGNYLRSC